MALTGIYTTIEAILEKVYRDWGFEDHIDLSDAAEWAGEALSLIGAARAYAPRITDGDTNFNHPDPIKITNYRGDLPCDLHLVVQTREYCNKIPMIYSGASFNNGCHVSSSPDLSCNSTSTCVAKNVDEVTSTAADDNTHCNPFFNFNPNPTAGTAYDANGTSSSLEYGTNLTYSLSGGKIFTSFKEGHVEMSYWAFPIDDNGYPLIPTEERFRKAVSMYLAHKVSAKLWAADKYSREKMEYFETEWLFYVQSAANQANMPSIDQMEALKNQWLRLIPNVEEHSDGFRYLSDQEIRYNN